MKILAKKSFMFRHDEKEFKTTPYAIMDAPDWITEDPYFDMVVQDQDLEVIVSKAQEKATEADESDINAPDSPYKGNPKQQIIDELRKRGLNFDLKSSKGKLEEILLADDKAKAEAQEKATEADESDINAPEGQAE